MQSSFRIAKLFNLAKAGSPKSRNIWTTVPKIVRGLAIPAVNGGTVAALAKPRTALVVHVCPYTRFIKKDPVKKPAEPAAAATDLGEEDDEDDLKPSATVINTSGKFANEMDAAADTDDDASEDRDEMLMEWYTRPSEDTEVPDSKKLLHVKEGMKGMDAENMEYAAVEDWDPDVEDLPQRNLKDLMAQEAVDEDVEEATKPVTPISADAKKDAATAAPPTAGATVKPK